MPLPTTRLGGTRPVVPLKPDIKAGNVYLALEQMVDFSVGSSYCAMPKVIRGSVFRAQHFQSTGC